MIIGNRIFTWEKYKTSSRHSESIRMCHLTRLVWLANQWRIQDFPEEGAPTLQGGAPTYDFAKFSPKLHEIERIWTPGGGGARPKFYYVDPPLQTNEEVDKYVL